MPLPEGGHVLEAEHTGQELFAVNVAQEDKGK